MKVNQTISRFISIMLFAGFLGSSVSLYSHPQKDEQQKIKSNSGYAILPFLSYMPQTKLAGGVVLNFYFREPGAHTHTKPSSLMPTFVYTQNQQTIIEAPIELYWHNERYYLNGYIGYAKFPDKFYGMGNSSKEENEENYTPRIFQMHCNVQQKLFAEMYIGFQYNFKYHKLLKVEDGELLSGHRIAGRGTGTSSGIGVSMTWDSRNSVFYPSDGTLIKILVQQFDNMIGSTYDFTKMSTDVRGYFEPFTSHVIAVNGYANFMTGAPPFHLLSLLGQVGERNLMRGYYQGRYRDNHIIVLQTEYRMPLWWRFGCAAFGSIGDVSHELSEFSVNSLKYTYGLGLRFQINSKENINLRLDFGFGKDSSGLYLAIGEAF